MKISKSLIFLAGLSLGLTASAATNRLETTFSAGATVNDGNSKSQQGNARLVSEGERDHLGSFKVGVEANYGESEKDDVKDTTVNNVKGFANVKKTLSEKTFAYFDLTLNHDEIADLRYRLTAGPGLGVFLVKTDADKLSLEAGPTFVTEDKADVKDEYLALRFAENGEMRFPNKSKIWESVEYLPHADDLGRYLLTAEIGAEAAVNNRISLRLVLQNKYDSDPGADLEHNDLALIAGISLKI
jgi:putative salt-induced outer membrane protein YdiY